MSTTTNTVKFNVGGRHFEVSRALLEEHSETMLGKLVSEAWQADPEERIFIDRDGDIFAHVLNYLRYGSIELPQNVPRSSFERDLDFYGIHSKEDDIKSYMADALSSLCSSLDETNRNYMHMKQKHNALLLAMEVTHHASRLFTNNKKMGTIQQLLMTEMLNIEKLYCDNIRGEGDCKNITGDLETYFLNFLKYSGLKCKKNSPHAQSSYSNCIVSRNSITPVPVLRWGPRSNTAP